MSWVKLELKSFLASYKSWAKASFWGLFRLIFRNYLIFRELKFSGLILLVYTTVIYLKFNTEDFKHSYGNAATLNTSGRKLKTR